MSFKFDWLTAYTDRGQMGSTDNSVALYLFRYAGADGGEIYPSITTLCAKGGKPGHPLGRATVVKALKELSEAGWIEVVRPGTRTTTTCYRLAIPVVHEVNHGGSRGELGGSRGEPQVVHEVNSKRSVKRSGSRAGSRAGTTGKPSSAIQAARKIEQARRFAFQPDPPAPDEDLP